MFDTSKTERLYYNDSYLTEFAARVIDVTATEDGRVAVMLDRTAFYPTGGGQPHDTGMIGEARVVECINQEEAGILHIIEGPIPQKGQTVVGRVDGSRRLDHIQQHTGQHILSQAFITLYKAETRGFRMMNSVSEIDVALNNPTNDAVEQAVDLANSIIWQNRPVHILNVTPAEAAYLPLRKDPAREGTLRIIEIKDFDLTPCGGTHVRHTGEVGLVAVRSWERAKGMTRIEFVAGGRALADYRRSNQTARTVAAMFSVGRDEAAASVARLLEANKDFSRQARLLEDRIAVFEADELISTIVPGPDDIRIVARTFDERSADELQRLAHKLVARPGVIALLGSTDNEGAARLVFARSPDAPGDMNVLMREACTRLEGRGGGRADFAQGGGSKGVHLQSAIDYVRSLLPGKDAR